MRKLFNTLKDRFYGCLPILILLGIPLIICTLIAWDNIVRILLVLGNGSILKGIIWGIPGITGVALLAFTLYYGVLTIIEKIGYSKFLLIGYVTMIVIGGIWLSQNIWIFI